MISATCAFAQDRFEISGVYSYLHFDPTTTGLGSRNFNPGGGAGVALNFLKIFAIKAEAVGYSSVPFTKTYTSSQTVPGVGTIPAGTYTAQGNMFSALAGPVLRIPIPKVKPFGEALFGISQTDGYTNLHNAIVAGGGTIARTPTEHPLTMALGGGVDIAVSNRISIRPAELDYVLTLLQQSANEVGPTEQLSLLRWDRLDILAGPGCKTVDNRNQGQTMPTSAPMALSRRVI